MKPLRPSHKESKRYLYVQGKDLKKNVPRAIHEFVGDLGMSKVSLKFIETGEEYAIICVNRDSLNHVRAALAVYKEKMLVKKASGTLKSLREVLRK
ncbi:MAG: Rpp14/Pop5 family protein [Candidatus Pacearchaeota archaeon]